MVVYKGGRMIYVLLNIHVQNGEYEHNHLSLHELPEDTQLDEWAENYAKEFYGSEADEDNGTYYFYGGEIASRVEDYKTLPPEDYKILKRYL